MNKNLNDKINGLITNEEITPNLGFLCLANLNDKINYANRDYSWLEPHRKAIATVLLNNGINKGVIAEKVMTIHKGCYPTLKGQIRAVYEMIVNGTFSFTDEQIPEHYIKYKSLEEYEEYIKKPIRYNGNKGNGYNSSKGIKNSLSNGRTLEDLSFEELEELQSDFIYGTSYNEIRKIHNLKPYLNLDSNLLKVTQDLRDDMLLEDFGWSRNDVEELIGIYNRYCYGLVFWNEDRDLESVEDLLEFLNYNDLCFEEELDRMREAIR